LIHNQFKNQPLKTPDMRAILVFCLSLSFYFLSAQSLIDSKHIGWSGGGIKLQTIHDKSGDFYASVLENADGFMIILYDRAFKEVHEYNIARLNQEELTAGFIKDGKIYLFCNYKSPAGYHNYTIDISSGDVKFELILSDKRKEKLIDRISSGDYALWLGIDKKNSNFVIYNWRNQQDMDTIIYHFKDPALWDAITKSGNVFSRDVDVAKIDEAGLPDIQAVSAMNKVYLIHDTLFLTMNRNDGNTIVYTFDLYNKTVNYRLIENEPVKREYDPVTEKNIVEKDYVDNSYLLNGKLIFISATSESMHVIFSDFYSGARLKYFEVKREDTIDFKNTPILQEGKALYFNNTKELTKTRQLLRKMITGSAAIAALNDSLGIAVTLGSNQEEKKMGLPGYSFSSGSTAIMIGGGGMGNFSSGTWTKAVRFRMQVDSSSFQYIPGNMEPSINDRIDEFSKDIKIPEHAQNLLFRDGRYIYIYYDKKKQSLNLQQFPI
jgi:hypothetical protein